MKWQRTEAKMSKLLHRAYARLKKNPEGARTWDESFRILRKGDHYILVLRDVNGANIRVGKSPQGGAS
jgi:hypothetical protein